MKFTREVIVNRTYTLSAREFVEEYLQEIRYYDRSYNFYVSDLVSTHCLTWVFEIPCSEMNPVWDGFDYYNKNTDEHKAAVESLIVAIEEKFEKDVD